MMNKIKILANIFSKITVCVLLASAIYITVMCGLDAKQGMIARQIIYFVYINCAVLGLGRAFGWFYFNKAKMVGLMEVLIIGVYVMVNLIVYVNDHMVAESMNQKLKEMRKRKEKL